MGDGSRNGGKVRRIVTGRAGAYATAVALPILATWLTTHSRALDAIPGAVYLTLITITAWFGYGPPILVSITLSLVLINYYLLPPLEGWSFGPLLLAREAVLGLLGGMIGFLNVRNRKAREAQEESVQQMRDVETEMRQLLADYEEQAAAFALAQQAGKSASWVLDVSTRKVRWLPGGYEVFGRPAAEYVGADAPINAVYPEDIPGIEAMLAQTLETGAPFQPEFRVIWPDGEMHWQEARGRLDPEHPHLIRGTTFDITERKLAEQSLLRVEKLAAVGRIASTIAHEINNPLAAVTNLLYLASTESSPEVAKAYVDNAQHELSRLGNIARLTLSYARVRKSASDVDPMEVVDGVLFLFRERLRTKGIQVERVAASPPVRVSIFEDELQRIVTNLVANAIDAIAAVGGRLRIAVQSRGGKVVLSVEDNGCGIPAESVGRIFDPFFTTKEETGTGVGLWVTKELVEKNGGSIVLGSRPEGEMRTCFEVHLVAAVETGESVPLAFEAQAMLKPDGGLKSGFTEGNATA